jgi:hypothetical protein
MRNGGCGNSMVFKTPIEIGHLLTGCVRKLKLFERLSIKILAIQWNSFQKHADKKKANKPMKWVKKVISILLRIISIARMKLLMLPIPKVSSQSLTHPRSFTCVNGFTYSSP